MTYRPDIEAMAPEAVKILAPSGILRAGINMSNFLLVSARTPDGGPAGVSPDLARSIAESMGLQLRYVPYESPGKLSDATVRDEWDIALVGAEPQRAEVISFTPAYVEIEATYLVPAGSDLQRPSQVDAPGRRIAVTDRTAYGLWLERNLRHAELVRTANFDDAAKVFLEQKLDALAGLRSRLLTDLRATPGARIMDGQFMAVQQAVGTPRNKDVAIAYLTRFVQAAMSSGHIADLIRLHAVEGLSVAKPAT